MKLSPEALRLRSRKEAESVAHVTMHSIYPVKVQVFKLCSRCILPPFHAFGLHPCLHGTMHMNFLIHFTNRFGNFTGAAPVYPEKQSRPYE